jgi:DNA polymerase I-like protein with 3'-5' exonuclease and polymerase domains
MELNVSNYYFIGNKSLINDINTSTVEECLDYFKDIEEIGIDTETEGKDPHNKKILSLQLGTFNRQYFIDTRYVNILQFKQLLETKKVIIHNAKFDYKFLKKAGIVVENIYDTMLAECVLYCGYEKYGYGLAALCKRYLNIDLDKSTRGEFSKIKDGLEFTYKQIEYACKDVEYLFRIKELQQIRAQKFNLNYCIELENNVVKALADIELNGMYLNAAKWKENTTNFKLELDGIEKQLDAIIESDSKLVKFVPKGIQGNLFGFEERKLNINYSSPTQIQKICKTLGFNIDSTNDRELQKLTNKHRFFSVLQEYRERAKIVSTYGEGFLDYINKTTGRVHTSFWQVLSTGRVSSGSKDDNAPNLQNIPASNTFRNCFEARPGFLWVSIDFSGQELNLMADGSNEEGFIDVLNRGEDLHCYAGSMMFKKTITKADKELRTKAKTINFGKPYGMGAPKLADTLSISIEEAEELFREYGKAFPKLNKWLDTQAKLAKQIGYSETFYPCKRKRFYPDLESAKSLRSQSSKYVKGSEESRNCWREIFKIEGQTERNGMNMPIQGSGADITKEALIGVRDLILKYNELYNSKVCYLICTVHDQIDVEVKEDLAEKFAKEMEEIMVSAGNKYVTKVNMKVDTTITKFWQK